MKTMKKSTPLLALVLPVFCLTASAQVNVGINGGAVLSSLVRDNNIAVQDGLAGYLVGINAKYNMGELGWFAQSGVDYTLEGDSGQKLNFVKVPLTLGFDFENGGSFFGTYHLAWQVGNDNGVQDFYKEFATILGFGFEIEVSKKFSLVTRLNYGLSNLVDDPLEAKNFTIKPFTLDLYITYSIFNSVN